MDDHGYLSIIDDRQAQLDALSDEIWGYAELAFSEKRSAAALTRALEAEGFAVERGLAGIPTAFSGRFGSGGPVIGILGEFDALSGLGQQAGATEPRPDGRPAGHGCGHNLLGVGSLGAALAAKRFLETSGRPGTVIYYGCPGEEGGSGKAFMARDGVFDALDAALCWHPTDVTEVRTTRTLANIQVLYTFDGRSAHAAKVPEQGRSALDAVELMNVGVNFLREHMPSDARIHYAITDSGGISPNVVQPHAEVLYLIRAPRNDQARALYRRVNDIARGAALMTETAERHVFVKACSNVVTNEAIQADLARVMAQLPPPEPDAEALAWARELTLRGLSDAPNRDPEAPLCTAVQPAAPEALTMSSTDVGDVSWVCPTAQIHAATWARGTPGHSWQVVAQGKTPRAHAMTRYAARVLAAEAVALLTRPELLAAAKAEHRRKTAPDGYVPPIPPDVRPVPMEALGKK